MVEKKKPFDAGDEAQVEEREIAADLTRKKEAAELEALLSARSGRAFVWRILERCRIYHSAPIDARDMMRFEGGRDVGIWLLTECLTASPNVYTLMRREAVARESEEE